MYIYNNIMNEMSKITRKLHKLVLKRKKEKIVYKQYCTKYFNHHRRKFDEIFDIAW